MTDFKVGDWVQGPGYFSGTLRKGRVVNVGEDVYDIEDGCASCPRSINRDDTVTLTFEFGDAEPAEGIDILVEQNPSEMPFLIRSGNGWEWSGYPEGRTLDGEFAGPWAEMIHPANSVCEVYGGEDPTPEKVPFKVGDSVQYEGGDWEEMQGATGVVARIDSDGGLWVSLDEDRDFCRAGEQAFWRARNTTPLNPGIGCWAPVEDGTPYPAPMPTERSSVLTEANDLINGERDVDYGPPKDNLGRIADLWNVQLGSKLSELLTAQDVALLMIQVKMGRVINRGNRDNFVDIAGYAAIAWETRIEE